MSETPFMLSYGQAQSLREAYGTPLYVYDAESLKARAKACLAFPNAYGLTVRYAMKAAPNAAILQLFSELGIWIDASSVYEVHRALQAGVPAEHISLSTQELGAGFEALIEQGVRLNACSLSQLERFGQAFAGRSLGLRFNPGLGSGGTSKTNVGGPASSFGIWHEQLETVRELVDRYDLTAERIHTHIGSGSDPSVWQRVASLSLDLVRAFESVHTLNLGGGYKIARVLEEVETNLAQVGAPVLEAFEELAEQSGRKIRLEIEPGTWLVGNAAVLLASVQDVCSTSGYNFLKLDAGMTEILRPSLYGSQHPIELLCDEERARASYVISGHCCESGDMLTPAPGEPDVLAPRELPEAKIGDLLQLGGCGAYCSSMSATNYNSFPQAAEVLLCEDGPRLIRRRQTLEQVLQNEVCE